MNLRVNLLKPAEYRYQGPVSKRFVIRASIISGCSFAALFLIVTVERNIALRANLRSAKAEWDKIGTHYSEVKLKQQDLAATQALLKELAGWNKTRVEWNRMLVNAQHIVPTTIQLNKLAVRGEWEFVKQTPLETPGGAPPPEVAPMPALMFHMQLEGKAVGETADDTVVQFARTIREEPDFQKIFETMRLQRFLRENVNSDEDSGRVFEIEGVSFARKME